MHTAKVLKTDDNFDKLEHENMFTGDWYMVFLKPKMIGRGFGTECYGVITVKKNINRVHWTALLGGSWRVTEILPHVSSLH